MKSTILENLDDLIIKSIGVSEKLLDNIVAQLRKKVLVSDKISSELLEKYQYEAHGVAWIATYVVSLRQMTRWCEQAKEENKLRQNY